MIKLEDLDVETRERWENKAFLEHGKRSFTEENEYLRAFADIIPWGPYEHYMMARLVAATPGQLGLLHIKFPPETAEDNRLHTHLYSDRLVTVLEGSGQFLIAPLGKTIETIQVKVGDRVWMPRGIRHTWYSGPQGLVVESLHNPFFAFNDPDILHYDDGLGYLEFLSDGTFIEKKLAGDISKKQSSQLRIAN